MTVSANDVLVHSLIVSGRMVRMFTEDLQPREWLHRASPTGNCPAWIVGHLTLTERGRLTPDVAASIALPADYEQRFARDESAPKLADYGDTSVLLPLFEQTRAKLIERARSLTPDELVKPLDKPHRLFKTVGEAINFMSAHAAMHAGQLSAIRRSMGKPPVV
ncbi:MAG: DinB family protein [Tepidisphaeraceae bacterium]